MLCKTLAENLKDLPGLKKGQKVVHGFDDPIKESGHLRILYGNLAEDGAVAKITGKEGLVFKAEDYVYSSAIEYAGEKGMLDVIVIKQL